MKPDNQHFIKMYGVNSSRLFLRDKENSFKLVYYKSYFSYRKITFIYLTPKLKFE